MQSDSFFFIGTMGAGYVFNVAGSLILIIVDELNLKYSLIDFTTGLLLSTGDYRIEEIDEPLPEAVRHISKEEFDALFERRK